MVTSEENNQPNRNAESHPKTALGELVKEIFMHLQSGRLEKAADLFLKAQELNILPTNRDVVKKLLDILGEDTAGRLIAAFAFHPCQFCTKGRTKCEICIGAGHIEEEAICERCFGFGVAKCGFCNGSGWMALADIPEGIRAAALIKRAEKTFKDADKVLSIELDHLSNDDPLLTLKKSAALWVATDKMMGVFENIVVSSQTSMVSSPDLDREIHDIIDKAVRTAAKLEQRIRAIVTVMQTAAELDLQIAPPDSNQAKLDKNRAAFYGALLDKSDLIYNLSDAHPLLEGMIKKYLGRKPLT